MGQDAAPGFAATAVLSSAEKFLRSFRRPGLLLLAFSGGGDSTVMLWAFARLLRSGRFPGFVLHAATVDHGLRAGSAEEAQAAAAFAASLGVPHTCLHWTGDKPATGIQAAAREVRYGLLHAEARRLGAVAVLTAHHADDQTETITMRRARGEGEGLSGMASAVLLHSGTWMLRPFLELGRHAIRQALADEDLPWSEDPSNRNRRFERVRVREDEPAVDIGIGQAAQLREASAVRQAEWLRHHVDVMAGSVAAVRPEGLDAIADDDGALALFKLSGAIAGKAHLPPRRARDRVIAFLRSGERGRMTLGGTVFDRRAAALYLHREARDLPVLVLRPGADGIWDGRYRFVNKSDAEVTIGPADRNPDVPRHLVQSGIPEAIARRAAQAQPLVAGAGKEHVLETRQIAAHARFLSGFELPVADCFVSLFGLSVLPPPPIALESQG
jgi:tRNA(Ile)-lysidine synthase